MKKTYSRMILVGLFSSLLLAPVANPVFALFFPEPDYDAKDLANALSEEFAPPWIFAFSIQKRRHFVLAHKGDWEKRQILPYFHQVRRRAWKGYFLLLNSYNREVYRVTGGIFGKPGGTRRLTNIRVVKIPPLTSNEAKFWVDNNEPLTSFFGLLFPGSFLIHNVPSRETIIKNNVGPVIIPKGSNLLTESFILLRNRLETEKLIPYNWDLKIEKVKPYYFRITTKVWFGMVPNYRWAVNTSRKVVYYERERANGWDRFLQKDMFVRVSGDPKNPTVFSVKLPDLTLGIQGKP